MKLICFCIISSLVMKTRYYIITEEDLHKYLMQRRNCNTILFRQLWWAFGGIGVVSKITAFFKMTEQCTKMCTTTWNCIFKQYPVRGTLWYYWFCIIMPALVAAMMLLKLKIQTLFHCVSSLSHFVSYSLLFFFFFFFLF